MNGLIGCQLCRGGKTWNQGKNTGLITDALGPFPDEPLLSAVDKALYLSCSLFSTLYGSAKSSPTVYNSGFLTDRSSSSESSNSVLPISQDQIKPRSPFISHSLPDLLNFKYGQNSSPRFDYCPKFKNETNYQQNEEVKARQWVKTKIAPNGIKCYEIWSNDDCKKCPSIIFIILPNGETVSFESISGK